MAQVRLVTGSSRGRGHANVEVGLLGIQWRRSAPKSNRHAFLHIQAHQQMSECGTASFNRYVATAQLDPRNR